MKFIRQTIRRCDSTVARTFLALVVSISVNLFLMFSAASAQRSAGGSATLAQTQGAPAGSFPLSEFDTANLFNGGLNFGLPILSIGGRGSAGYTIPLKIERKWTTLAGTITVPEPGVYWYPSESIRPGVKPGYSPGVMQIYRSGFGDLACEVYGDPNPPHYYEQTMTKLIFTTSDGTEYEFQGTQGSGSGGSANVYFCDFTNYGFNRGKIFRSTDGSGMTFISDQNIYDLKVVGTGDSSFPSQATGYLLLKNGTRYWIDEGYVRWVRDSNGNLMTFTYNGGVLQFINDSIGRTVEIQSSGSACGGFDDFIYSGFDGVPRRVRVGYACLGDTLRMTRTGDPVEAGAIPYEDLFPTQSYSPTLTFNPRVVSYIELPGQIMKYQLYYNIYGELARVELPTGGAIEYDHGSGWVNPQYVNGLRGMYGQGSEYVWQIYRRVLERRVYVNKTDQVPESRMTYSVPDDNTGAGGTAYVEVNQFGGCATAPFSKQRHYFVGNAAPFYEPSIWYEPIHLIDGKEEKVELLSGSGSLLRRAANSWNSGPAYWKGPYIAETVTMLANGSTPLFSKQQFTYDDHNNLTDVYEYGFGESEPGTVLLRRTHTEYLTTNSAQNGADYASGTDSTSIHIRNLPSEQWVSTDSAGDNKVARTTYEYDNYTSDSRHAALVDRQDVIGLCTNFTLTGECSNPGPTAYQTRGNATGIKKWLLSNNTSVDTNTQFDIVGNAVITFDALGHATTVCYTDNFGTPDGNAVTNTDPTELYQFNSYAFPTSIINSLGHTAHTQYDYYLGKLVDTMDANGVTASTFYNEGLDRPTKVIIANNITALRQQKSFTYDDTYRITTVTSDLRSHCDKLIKSQMFYDGLGRTVETRRFENATDYISTLQIPFNVHQESSTSPAKVISKASSPFRPQRGEEPLWSTTITDSLGRIESITTPDNSVVSTTYSGNTVTVTDQGGKVRRSVTDSLGRLIRVDEPNSSNALGAVDSPVQSTSYTYDATDNLRKVVQGQQARYFLYDSLSQLIRVRTPEHAIDTGLNLSSDTLTDNNNGWTTAYVYDSNGNPLSRTDARGSTTAYQYDSLGRVTQISHTGGTAVATPTVTHVYDDPAVAYSKGLLTSVSSSVSSNKHTAFDALGRATASQQITGGQTYSMSYLYDLAGNMTSQVYPSGRAVTQSFDNAGKLAALSGQPAGGTPVTYVNAFAYSSHGAVVRMRLGNGRFEHMLFNSRLQPTEIGLGSNAASSNVLKLELDYGATNNNGNVLTQKITVPGLGQLTQTYTYDALNRLLTAAETSGGSGWQQHFQYDPFGNRQYLSAVTNYPYPLNMTNNPSASQSNNRLENYGYDPAGNVTQDTQSHTYAFDAENRMVQYDGGASNGGASYDYDGDGRRVKKTVGTVETLFVYNVVGQLVAEYTVNGIIGNVGTSYLTSDTIGSPRIVTGADGSVKARHDYLPFGEEIPTQFGGRNSHPDYLAVDSVRQAFAQYERDGETKLDFAQARYYSSAHGRFNSTDPIFFQSAMAFDPQLFSLYTYARNNPLKFVDPDGERVHLYGNEAWLISNVLYEMVGGAGQFNRYFEIIDGEVRLRSGVNLSEANEGVRELAGYVALSEHFIYFAGDDGEVAATLFADKNQKRPRDEFNGKSTGGSAPGFVVGTRGRGNAVIQPGVVLQDGSTAFAIIAYNTDTVQVQTGDANKNPHGIARGPDAREGTTIVEFQEQWLGRGQRIAPVRFFIHESAENQEFAKQARAGGPLNYGQAHRYAMRREGAVRRALQLPGGFAGAELKSGVQRKGAR